MHLFIMRHGIACDPEEWCGSDADRPLTPEGAERTLAVLKKLKKNDELEVDAIWSSPFVRAKQTADLAGAVLGLEVKTVDPLECGADLATLMRYTKCNPMPERLLTVGHEPDCGELVANLIGDESGDFPFKRAGIARLKGDFKPGGMKLVWHYTPKDVLGD